MKIDKKLLFSSLFIILLLAVGAVSASDNDDVLSVSAASSDIDELAIDTEIDNANSEVNDKLNNVLVNSEENDDVSTINPDNEEINDNVSSENNVSSSEAIVDADELSYGEDILGSPATVNIQNIINNPAIASIPGFQTIIDTLNGIGKNDFNVQEIVDLLKNLGDTYNVNIPAITDALNEINKKYNVNPSNLIAALNELEANYNLNAKDIVDTLNTFANDNLNVEAVIKALGDISGKYNIDIPDFIGTLEDIGNKYNLDPSAFVAALITLNNNPDLNVKDVVDALNGLSDRYGFEVPNFIADLGNLAEKYNFDVSELADALRGLADTNNLNVPELADALKSLAEKYSFDAFDLASALSGISGKYNLNVSQLAGVLDNLADKYDLNVSDLAAALNALAEKYNFDASDLAALSDLAKKYNFDASQLAAALSDLAGKYNFDVADLAGVLNNLAGKYDWNVSDLIAALSTLAEKYNLDISQIENALRDILDSISSDEPKLDSFFIAPTRIISVANGISGYDYKFILKDAYGLPIANRDVLVLFNGKTQTVKTDKDGWGTVTIHGNAAGEYIMMLTFVGDRNNNPSYRTATIKLIKEKTMFIAPDRAVYVQQMARGYKYSAILKDQNGNPLANKKVLFIIDGKKVVGVTDEKGWATVTLNAVTVGAQTLTIKFAGTATCYYETSLTRTIKIVREQSRLSVPDKVYSASSNAKKVTATLLSKSGNPIYGAKVFLNVDGKTYSAVTNNLGIATFSINLAKTGVFTATTRFDDSRFFAATAAKSKITIN